MKRLNLEFDSELSNKLIKCKRCGKCCTKKFFKSILMMPEDIKRIEKRFNKPIEEIFAPSELSKINHCGKDFLAINQPCKFYVEGCTIYEDRPLVCRQYPIYYIAGEIRVDDINCLAAKEAYENKKEEYEKIMLETFGRV